MQDSQKNPRAPGEKYVPLTIESWDAKYREDEGQWFFGREPSELARLTYSYWKLKWGDRRGRVLDLGCGEGRDAVYFTRKGFTVTAVDGSEAALEKAESLARDFDVKIDDLCRMDVLDFPLTDEYDIVFSHNCLQFIGDHCLPILRRLQEITPPGGLNAISAFTREAESLAGVDAYYRFDHNELKYHYNYPAQGEPWRLLFYGEEILWREPSHAYLSFARIIAQKE